MQLTKISDAISHSRHKETELEQHTVKLFSHLFHYRNFFLILLNISLQPLYKLVLSE